MWTKLDDGLESHRKLADAALLVRKPAAYTRALGAFTLALLYANRYLTDGFVPSTVFDSKAVPAEDIDALCRAQLLDADPIKGGFWIHDFLEWNPSAEEVRARRKRDNDRKKSRQGYRVEATAIPNGAQTEPATIPVGFRAESAQGNSRAVPVPSRPDLVHPPNPPPSGGRRMTRAERKAALRALGPCGPIAATWRDACGALGHTPPCGTPTACALRAAQGGTP